MYAKFLGKQSELRDLWAYDCFFFVCVCNLQVNYRVTKLILTMYIPSVFPSHYKLPQQALVLECLRQGINGSWKGET